MENNSQESNQNTNYQSQNQGQAYPQPQNVLPQNQMPKDPQLRCQKSLLYQQAENLEQINGQDQPSAYLQQLQQPFQQIQQPYTPYQPIYASQNANAGVLPEEPISFSDWMITFLLLCIPVINIVFLILWAFGKHSKKSKENYAKAALVWVFIWTLIGFTIFTVIWGIINGTL